MAKPIPDESRLRAARVSSRVYQYMYERIGQVVFIKDLATLGITQAQISRAISYLNTRDTDVKIEIVMSSNSYRMVPIVRSREEAPRPAPASTPVKANKRMFEEIGVAQAGIVIQDDSGKLYIAKEM